MEEILTKTEKITIQTLDKKEIESDINLDELKEKAKSKTLNLGEIQNILNYLLNK